MIPRFLLALSAIFFVAACEPERGAGFTGIGSQNATGLFDLTPSDAAVRNQ